MTRGRTSQKEVRIVFRKVKFKSKKSFWSIKYFILFAPCCSLSRLLARSKQTFMFIAFTWLDFLFRQSGNVQEWCRIWKLINYLVESASPVEWWRNRWKLPRRCFYQQTRMKNFCGWAQFSIESPLNIVRSLSKPSNGGANESRPRKKSKGEEEAITWNVTKLINSFGIEFILHLLSPPFIDDKEF